MFGTEGDVSEPTNAVISNSDVHNTASFFRLLAIDIGFCLSHFEWEINDAEWAINKNGPTLVAPLRGYACNGACRLDFLHPVILSALVAR